LTTYIDAWTANGWRYGISALFWAVVLLHRHWRRGLPKGLWRAALVPSVINITGQCCFAWTPYLIDPGLLTFVLRFQIVLVALGAWIFFPAERYILRARGYWVGTVVVILGSVGVCLLGTEMPTGTTAIGVLLAILSGVCFAGYSLSVRHYMDRVSPVLAFASISQLTALGLVVIMLIVGADHGAGAMSMQAGAFGMLVASAFIGIALAHVFYYDSIARLGVAVTAGVISLQPFLTGVASAFLFGERLTVLQWSSGMVAVGGATVMLRTQHRLSRRDTLDEVPEPYTR
jgi:drug/metabolite transporter (DMT)-like permease